MKKKPPLSETAHEDGPQRERLERITALVKRLRPLNAAQRTKVLDETCSGDETLRDEVETQLGLVDDSPSPTADSDHNC